jgi:glycogen operon protein
MFHSDTGPPSTDNLLMKRRRAAHGGPVRLEAGMAHPAVIEHLTGLGVNAVELMPVHHHIDDGWLLSRGLRNYWGYNTIGFFAPHPGYASSAQPEAVIDEFKSMVRALQQAGIEVVLDVVYNHTADGDHLGPTISFRGIDNAAYYHLDDTDPYHYPNFSKQFVRVDAEGY